MKPPINTGRLMPSIRPTYQSKLDELRLEALRIIEDGLDDSNDPLIQFINAVQLLPFTSANDLNKPLPEEPDPLDAEEISVKEN